MEAASPAQMREPNRNSIPVLCHGCAKPVLDDGTSMVQCDECAAETRRPGPSRIPPMASQITLTLAAGAIVYAAASLAAEVT